MNKSGLVRTFALVSSLAFPAFAQGPSIDGNVAEQTDIVVTGSRLRTEFVQKALLEASRIHDREEIE